MKQFVIIFRQAPRQFTESDLKKPRILEPADDAQVTAAGPVSALLFLEARDFDQAGEIARTHPAVRYNASVEVRAWLSPSAQQ